MIDFDIKKIEPIVDAKLPVEIMIEVDAKNFAFVRSGEHFMASRIGPYKSMDKIESVLIREFDYSNPEDNGNGRATGRWVVYRLAKRTKKATGIADRIIRPAVAFADVSDRSEVNA